MKRSRQETDVWRYLCASSSGLLLALLSCSAAAPYIEQGIDLETQGRYEEAISLYQSVIASGEAPPEKMAERLDAAKQGLAAARAKKAMTALESGDHDRAISLAGEASAFAPDSPDVHTLLETLASEEEERAATMVDDGNIAGAIAVLDALLAVYPGYRRAQEVRDDLVQSYTQQKEDAARNAEKNGLPGNAFLATLTLSQLYPGRPELAEDAAQRREALIQRYRHPVTWEIQDGARWAPELDEALSALNFASPYLYRKGGPRTGESLHVTLSNFRESITDETGSGTGKRSIPDGTRKVPNPKRQEIQADAAEIMDQLHTLGDRIDALHAQETKIADVADRNRLLGTITQLERQHNALGTQYVAFTDELKTIPAEVEIPNYREVSIRLERLKRTMVLRAAFFAHIENTSPPMEVRFELNGEAVTEGEGNPAYPEYGISAREPQLADSENALRRQAVGSLAASVGETIDALINDMLILELQKARELAREGEKDEAAELFVKYLLGTSDDPPEDLRLFLEARGDPDAALIRGGTKHPGP